MVYRRIRVSGQITVYLSLVFLLLVALIFTTIESVRVDTAVNHINNSAKLALDSVFSEYHRELLEEYNLIFLDESYKCSNVNEDNIAEKITDYMDYNINPEKDLLLFRNDDLLGINNVRASISSKVAATDYGGGIFASQVVEYEKYNIAATAVESLLNMEDSSYDNKAVDEVTEKITNASTNAATINETMYELIELVEGISYEGKYTLNKDGYLDTEKYFVKMIMGKSTDMTSAGINNSIIYSSVKDKYINVYEECENIKSWLNELKELYRRKGLSDADNVSSETEVNIDELIESAKTNIIESADKISDACEKSCEYTDYALEYIGELRSGVDTFNSKIDDIKTCLSDYSDEISEDLYSSLQSTVSSMSGGETITDIPLLESQLTINREKLCTMASIKEISNSDMSLDSVDNLILIANSCGNTALTYDVSQETFDYTNFTIDEYSESTPMDVIEDYINSGIMSLVSEDEISDKTISDTNLPSISGADDKVLGEAEDAAVKDVLYNEYVMDSFDRFTKVERDGILSYEIEYIIAGEKSDRDNIASVVKKILLIREGVNLVYLLTDADKCSEAETLAVTICGFSAMPVIIKATQFAILAAWAYGESIIELRTLLKGNKVPVIKNASNFKLDLEGLMQLANRKLDEDYGDCVGLSYEEYLRILLFTMNSTDKYYRTMDVIQVNIRDKYDSTFLMRDMVYAIEVVFEYKVRKKFLSFSFMSDYHITMDDYVFTKVRSYSY